MSDRGQQISNALVLAAGNGKRLKSHIPKPAHRLLGVPLLARTLLGLQKAGVTDAWVVLGYEADRVRQELEGFDRLSLRIHWLYNESWREPNGLSVLAGEPHLNGPFLLTMADHLFDPAIAEALVRSVPEPEGINLAVDYAVAQVFDIDDATKVRVEQGSIVGIGKDLDRYDAIDTGIFLASPGLFRALRESVSEGKASLSDGVQRLAAAGKARVTDVSGLMWQDIDTPEALAEAGRKLLGTVRKKTDGPIARFVNRPVSMAISRHLVRTSITPNQLSVLNLLIGLVSAGLVAVGGYGYFLAGGVLFQLASILDGVDGEVAKLTFRSTKNGEWIDTACDQISYVAFLVGLVIGVYRSGLPELYFQLGVLGLVAGVLSIGNIALYLVRHRESGSALSIRYGFQEGSGVVSRVMRFVQYLGKRDLLAFLVMVLAIVGQLPFGLVLFGVGGTLVLFPVTAMANFGSSTPMPALVRQSSARSVIPVSQE